MKEKTKLLLREIKENINTTLDLSMGHDDPNHIANYILRECSHPIYYQHGFYKSASIFKEELYSTPVSQEDCDYCLVQCLECGDFLGIDKPDSPMEDWFHKYKGETIRIIQTKMPYEKARLLYLKSISKSNKNEVKIVKKFQKKYQN